MNRTSLRRMSPAGASLAGALWATSALTPTAALAQDVGSGALGEVIVTAQKRSENIQKVPMSIQAIDTKQLEQLNVNNFQDYVKFLPSVDFQTFGPNQTSIYMRGIASGDNANHSGPLPSVGVYLDEQPITTIGGTLDIHVYDIARVEVLPGPQGTLYGASSEAGTLRFITNKPSTAGFAAGYDLEGNAVDHGDAGGVAEGFVNIPINSHAAVRLVGFAEHDGGYIDNVLGARTFSTSGVAVTNASRARKAFNPNDTVGGRGALKIDLDNNWTIEPTIMGQIQRNSGVFGYEPAVGYLQAQRFTPDTFSDHWYQAAMTIMGKIGRYDLTYSGGYFNRALDSRTDYTDYSIAYDAYYGSGVNWQDANGNPLARPQQSILGKDRFDKTSNELRITSPGTDRLRFIAGLFEERQSHWIVQDYQIPGFGPQISVPGFPGTIWLTDQMRVDRDDAAFGEASFDITPQLTLTAGVRVYEYRNALRGFYGFGQGYNALTGYGSGQGVGGKNCLAGLQFRDAPCVNLNKVVTGSGETHKVNLEYKFDDQRLAYVTYSTGYRPGGVNRSGSFGPYNADTLTNYEVGLKTSWLERRLRLNADVYYETWDRFQFSFLGPNSLTIIENAPAADVRGVEGSLDWQVMRHLSLSGGLSFNDAHLTKNFCGTDQTTGLLIASCSRADAQAPKGEQLPYTPRFKGNLTARYTFDVADWNAFVQGSVNAQSRNFATLRPGDTQFVGVMPGFGTADFSIGASRNRLSLEFFVKNAFDQRGQINRYVPCTTSVCGMAYAQAGAPASVYVVPILPMTLGVRIGQRF